MKKFLVALSIIVASSSAMAWGDRDKFESDL